MSTTPPSSVTTQDIKNDINKILETPRSHRSNGGKAAITRLRRVIAVEMDREFVELPFDSFMEAYLPFVPSDEVMEKVKQHLLSEPGQASSESEPSDQEFPDAAESLQAALKAGKSLLLRHDGRLMFHAFPQPPSQSNGTEKSVYSPLSKISEQISKITDLIPGRQRNQFHYRDVSSKTIHSEKSGSNNKIDACFMRGDSVSRPPTHDIAVVIEQKLSSQQRGGNNRQAVSANVQIMNDDVRRMFTFGITIESDQVTVWFHSRSHSAICERFSLVKQPDRLLKVFASFLFATKAELGYDPLVEYLGKGHYVFSGIQNPENPSELDKYKTLDTISEIRANNITGRMARVFTVVKYMPKSKRYGTKKYVLKDVWLDDKAQTERQLQGAMFGDIDKFWTSDDTPTGLESIKESHRDLVLSKAYKKHFLTIEGDYVGEKSKSIPPAYRPVRGLLAGPLLEDELPNEESITASRMTTNKSKANYTVSETIKEENVAYEDFARDDFERSYSIKRQYRVVFSEVCRTVGQFGTLGEAIDILAESLTPLELMLCAGWVHRDLSAGNIMAYRQNLDNNHQPWRVILADFEYAKKFPPHSPSGDSKTGTPYYMPIEIMLRKTLFQLNQKALKKSTTLNANAGKGVNESQTTGVPSVPLDRFDRAMKRLAQNRAKQATDEDQGVVHNFQHDLESIWWLVLYMVTCRVGGNSAETYGRKIFRNSIKASQEKYEAIWNDISVNLMNHLGETLAEHFAEDIEAIRETMVDFYLEREEDMKTMDVSSYVPVSQSFRRFFASLKETQVKWGSTPLTDPNPYINPAERKRPRPEDDDNDAEPAEDGEELETARRSKLSKV